MSDTFILERKKNGEMVMRICLALFMVSYQHCAWFEFKTKQKKRQNDATTSPTDQTHFTTQNLNNNNNNNVPTLLTGEWRWCWLYRYYSRSRRHDSDGVCIVYR